MSIVGFKAPKFSTQAVINGKDFTDNFSLEQFKENKYVVLFFYPADFTFVCPTEIIAFQDKLAEFEKRNVAVVGCSVDSHFSHLKWLQTEPKDGGIKGVTYPLISDQTHSISTNYGVFAGQLNFTQEGVAFFEGSPLAMRGIFLINKEGIIKHETVNDMELGRNIDEIIRIIDALQFSEKHGQVCPANWKKGDKGMEATQDGIKKYLSK